MNKTVAVALSGGIDSAITAHILMKTYHVIGVTMITHDAFDELEDAKALAKELGIEHHIIDLRAVFHSTVITPFADDYFNGITPNPCILCNEKIKFGALMDYALSLGADFFSTGHYVSIETHGAFCRIIRGKAPRKDQSYNLYFLNQERLAKLLFPMGEFSSKEAARTYAQLHNLNCAYKKDSDGLCFTEGKSHPQYLKDTYPNRIMSGDYVNTSGEILGSHSSIVYHTIGQKRNLQSIVPDYLRVCSINPGTQSILLDIEEALYRNHLELEHVTLPPDKSCPFKATIQLFQWGHRLTGTIHCNGNNIHITFDQPVRAIAPGQHAVFYEGNRVLGGGIVK
jgi:tRNA-specific 2-thiouridylase